MKLTHRQAEVLSELIDASSSAYAAYELMSPGYDSSGHDLQAKMERLAGVLDEAAVAFGSTKGVIQSAPIHAEAVHHPEWQEEYDAAG